MVSFDPVGEECSPGSRSADVIVIGRTSKQSPGHVLLPAVQDESLLKGVVEWRCPGSIATPVTYRTTRGRSYPSWTAGGGSDENGLVT